MIQVAVGQELGDETKRIDTNAPQAADVGMQQTAHQERFAPELLELGDHLSVVAFCSKVGYQLPAVTNRQDVAKRVPSMPSKLMRLTATVSPL